MKPKRIQRKRTMGWKKPENTVCVTRPGRWGNQFRVGPDGTAAECVESFREWILGTADGYHLAVEARDYLRGRDLACWCPWDAEFCHADVLLEIANQ